LVGLNVSDVPSTRLAILSKINSRYVSRQRILKISCDFKKKTGKENKIQVSWKGNINLRFYSNIYPTRSNITQFILSGNCSTCFGWYHHPLSGAQTTVSTASGICHTVTAICRHCGRVGTGLSVLWVACATHSTLKRHTRLIFE